RDRHVAVPLRPEIGRHAVKAPRLTTARWNLCVPADVVPPDFCFVRERLRRCRGSAALRGGEPLCALLPASLLPVNVRVKSQVKSDANEDLPTRRRAHPYHPYPTARPKRRRSFAVRMS